MQAQNVRYAASREAKVATRDVVGADIGGILSLKVEF